MTSPKREFAEYLEALRARLGREHRAPTHDEWRGLRDRHAAWTRWIQTQDDAPRTPGHVVAYVPPTRWELFEVEFGPEPAPLVAADVAGDGAHAGGRPLEPVMTLEKAGELQAVIDLALKNGHRPVVANLARRFGITRDRVTQALEMRDRPHPISLWDPAGGSPQFSAVVRSDGNVHWPSLEKLRQH